MTSRRPSRSPQTATDVRQHKQHEYTVARGVARALNTLGVHVPTRTAFHMAEVVVLCMSGEHRTYHDMQHVYAIAPQGQEDDSALGYLATLFHDIVHLKADGELPPCVLPSLIRAGLIPLPHQEQLPGLRTHNRAGLIEGAQEDEAMATEVECTRSYTRSDSGVLGSRGRGSEGNETCSVCSVSGTGLKFQYLGRVKHKDVRNDVPQLLPQEGGDLARERRRVLCKPKSLALLALSHPRESDSRTFAVADEVLSWWSGPTTPSAAATQKQRQVAQKICYKLFGHKPGQVLDFSSVASGLSEFLSCVVAMDLLSPWLDELQLLHVCACIEATIPFRPSSCLDQLWLRCMQVAVEDLEHAEASRMSIASHMHTVVESACRMVSRDLGNFASLDTREFLANTWALVPELNPALRSRRTFTLRSWMQAFANNVGFFEFLAKQPERVFLRFGDSHSQDEHERMLDRAGTNLQRGRMYMGARLLTAGIMHALLKRAGVDEDSRPVGRLLVCGMGGLVPSNTLGTMRVLVAHADGSRTLQPLRDSNHTSCTTTATINTCCCSSSSRRRSRSCGGEGASSDSSTDVYCGSSRFGAFDFGDQGVDAVQYVEQLLLQGFVEEGAIGRSTDVNRHMFSSVCEASAFVFRSTTVLQQEGEEKEEEEEARKRSEGCFERCVKTTLAYLNDEVTGHTFLKRVPYDCVEYVATHVVAASLDHMQRAALEEWLE